MLGFILGISITINIVLVIAIIIYLNVKNKAFSVFIEKDLQEDAIVDKKEADDFFKDDKLDFSNLLRK